MTDDAKLLAQLDWVPELDPDRWECIQRCALIGLGERDPDLLATVELALLNVVPPAEGSPWMTFRSGSNVLALVHRDSLNVSSDSALVRYADGAELVN